MLAELEAKAINSAETSERLESELAASKAESESLRSDLAASRKELAELSLRLASSEMRAGQLSSWLGRAERSLADSQALAKAKEVELWVTRGAAVLGFILTLVAALGH